MNHLVVPETGPGNIVYINDTPYHVASGSVIGASYKAVDFLVKLGDRGEKVDCAVILYNIEKPNYNTFKITRGCCYAGWNGKDYNLIRDDIVGGVFKRLLSRLSLIQRNGKVITYGFPYFDPVVNSYYLGQANDIKKVYPTGDTYAILQDTANNLFIWEEGYSASDMVQVPGKEVRLMVSTKTDPSGGILHKADLVLTNEGLFLFHSSRHGVLLRKVDLPKTVHPDDIKAIETFTIHNIFLLTNDGGVYATGENDYYQRGSKKKLNPDSWNEIKYPEKIKQLGISYKKPGLFALSENGNLYYHGYNEDGYYPVTGRKSNISEPIKILEGIKSIWTPRFNDLSIQDPEYSTLWVYPVWLFDSTGDFFMLPVGPLVGGDYKSFLIKTLSKAYPADVYKMVSHDIVYTPDMVHAILKSNC